MNDKNFKTIALIAGVAIIAWWLLRKRAATIAAQQSPQQANIIPIGNVQPNGPLDPLTLMFTSNPQSFLPASINVNVTPNLPDGLQNGYIPLFGFVGIAQGETFQ